jgi:predicted AlkP superfamily phosphohydrolase/phosphomutase
MSMLAGSSKARRRGHGIVDPGDFEKVRDRVNGRARLVRRPEDRRKPVKTIYKREEVFKAKRAHTAPDILMEPEVGYSLMHAKSAIEDADWISATTARRASSSRSGRT